MKGWTFTLKGKDVFVETEAKRKTGKLIRQICQKLQLPDNPGTLDVIHYFMRKAECDIHTLSNGKQYYEIHGDGFGGRGSFVDDGNTIIIKL